MYKILIAVIILMQFRGFSQPFSDEEKRILELQDRRDASAIVSMNEDGELKNNTLVKKALTALANISDSSACETIINIYKKTNNSEVKSVAAFALGQIPSFSAINYLREIEKRENSDNFRRTRIIINTFNALGKIGNENDLERICKYTFKNDELNGVLALSIARFGMRKIKSRASFEKLRELTFSLNDANHKKWVAYAFNRIGDKETLLDYKKELEFLTTSENIFCRMWAISALGKTGDASYTEYIMSRYSGETDWRVKVNMLNAVGNLNPDENNLSENYFDMIMHSAVDDANPNVSVTACQNLAKICINLGKEHSYPVKLKEFFENYLQPGKVTEPDLTNEIILTLAKIFKDDYRSRLFELFSQKEEYSTKSAIVSAFQYMDDPLVYKELRDSISAEVQRYNLIHPNKDGSMIGSPELAKLYRAFVETLSALDDKMDDESKNIVRLIFSEFASSRDPAITDISLTALADSLYSKYRDETAQILLFDIEGFDEKNDKDVMIMYINTLGMLKNQQTAEKLKEKIKSEDYDIAKAAADALKQITGKDYINDIEASKIISDFDWNFIDKLNNKKIANILTEKGNIKIELFPNTAPFTVKSFVKLGEKGFYNGTVFHRVVPNFVIQGGDPTGTGYGGPGYSIRTEIADNTFDSYFLGMASSGKDTEGSQFFITHSPQPHLDGKYTIFGKVIEGFDVVDKIQVGDKIRYIVFSSN